MNTETFVGALEAFQDRWVRRATPSPSTIGQCIRKQWFLAKNFPFSNRSSAQSILAFERGTNMQPIAYDILQSMGAKVSPDVRLSPELAAQIGCERGAVDGLFFIEDKEEPEDTGLWLLEVKVLGAWGYLSFIEKGLAVTDPFDVVYIDQVQSYLLALSTVFPLKGCLFLVFCADPSGTNWIATKIKKWSSPPPPLCVAKYALNPDTAGEAVARAKQVSWLRDNVDDPRDVPRDYDPMKPDKPCSYCGFLYLCKEAQ